MWDVPAIRRVPVIFILSSRGRLIDRDVPFDSMESYNSRQAAFVHS